MNSWNYSHVGCIGSRRVGWGATGDRRRFRQPEYGGRLAPQTLPKGAALGKIATNLGSQPQIPALAMPPVAAISPNGLSVTCNGFLPSNRQECTRTADLAFTSDGSSSWTATL